MLNEINTAQISDLTQLKSAMKELYENNKNANMPEWKMSFEDKFKSFKQANMVSGGKFDEDLAIQIITIHCLDTILGDGTNASEVALDEPEPSQSTSGIAVSYTHLTLPTNREV